MRQNFVKYDEKLGALLEEKGGEMSKKEERRAKNQNFKRKDA